jgi:TonB family protein
MLRLREIASAMLLRFFKGRPSELSLHGRREMSFTLRAILLFVVLALPAHAQSRQDPYCPELLPLRTTLLQCQVTTDVHWRFPLAMPLHPPEMLAAQVGGFVRLGMTVNLDGSVDSTSIKVFQSPHALFTAAARVAVLKWRGTPARLGETPVREYREQDFLFELPPSQACTWSGPWTMGVGIPACAPTTRPQLPSGSAPR